MGKILAALAILLTGCGDGEMEFIEVHKSELKNYGADPLYHTRYLGSDKQYHYFVWARGKTRGLWKVNKSTMPFGRELIYGEGSTFVYEDEDGNILPLFLKLD